MTLSLDDIRKLTESGNAVTIAADGSVTVTPTATKRPLTAAEKQQAYRDRQKIVTGVTEKVTPTGEIVTGVTKKVTKPSPPPLPPTPPNPAPTPASDCVSVPACEGTPGKSESPTPPVPPKAPNKRQLIESDITAANAASLPLDLRTDGFPAAWDEWCEHRTTLYRRDPRKRWSAQAARNTLAECARHGSAIGVMAIRAAISNGWQGLVWDRLQPAPPGGSRKAAIPSPPVNPDKWKLPS